MSDRSNNKVAKVYSAALTGYDGALIEVETDMKAGLPGVQIVGMGNKAIDEARQRVRSAITNSLLDFPARKLTVNLAPAELPKDGTHLDVPIALSILIASGQLKQHETDDALFAGELALDGSIRPIRGAVVIAEIAKNAGSRRLFIPHDNATQARLVTGIDIIGISTFKELYGYLKGATSPPAASDSKVQNVHPPAPTPTFDDIIGHEQAKRALTIAAAGRHNLLFSGSPGSGKTLLAQSLSSILPALTPSEILEVTKVHSLSLLNEPSILTHPPFRAPHHSVTLTALIGGGLRPRPGDISLAHKGVLFLDELPEYPRATLEALRQPLEDRSVRLSRLYGHITYPADFLLIATMNPCPCGYYGDASHECTCAPSQLSTYQKKISGPLLDRIDLRLTVPKVQHEQFISAKTLKQKQHFKVLDSISIARMAQEKRYKRSDFYNAYASFSHVKNVFQVTAEAKNFLDKAARQLDLSSRGYLRTIRVARTIADLESSPQLNASHVAEALQYR